MRDGGELEAVAPASPGRVVGSAGATDECSEHFGWFIWNRRVAAWRGRAKMADSFVAGGKGKSSLGLCQACHSRRSWLRICVRRWECDHGKLSEGVPSAASFAAASARSLPDLCGLVSTLLELLYSNEVGWVWFCGCRGGEGPGRSIQAGRWW